MNKCKEEFEKWYETLPDAERPPFRYGVWQDAWNARQPEVVGLSREELVDMMDGLGESDDEGKGWAVWDRDFGKLADNILDRIKGATMSDLPIWQPGMWYTQTTTMIPKRLPKRYPSMKSYGKGKRK